MKSERPLIEIDKPAVAFDRHFFDQDNKRIVFSGKFGSGKTYFLNEFFNIHKDKINTFWLSPVKYAVSQNEDIFEYIKVDIAYHLIKDGHIKSILKQHFPEELYIDQYLKNKPLEIVKILAYAMQSIRDIPDMSAKITSSVGTAIEKLTSAFEAYKTFKKTIAEKLKSDFDVLGDYLKTSNETKGSIFENDLITQTIQVALELCREEENVTEGGISKQNILVIDDFDRLDPEHIFRILNVLSVHNDHFGVDNKFGFDKIVVVCDINNIENIYAYRYGDKVDFTGYMSKFFSADIFHFDNSVAVQDFCRSELRNIIKDEDAEIVLGLLLAHFVKIGLLTIRNIIKYDFYKPMDDYKLNEFDFIMPQPYPKSRLGYSNIKSFLKEEDYSFFTHSSDFPILQAIRVLSVIFGDYNKMKKAFNNTTGSPDSIINRQAINSLVRALVPIINIAVNYNNDPGRIIFGVQDASGEKTWVTYPTYTFMGKPIPILVGWTEQIPYDGKVSYYKNVKEGLRQADYSSYDFNNPIGLKYVLEQMARIFDFIEQSPLLNFWGMTK